MTKEQIRGIASKTLLEAGVRRLPVRIGMVAQRLGISLFTYQRYAQVAGCDLSDVAMRYGCDGFTQRIGGHTGVFYYPDGNLRRMRWTIAHELGHILLGHMEGYSEEDADEQADAMAAELLCPSAVLAARVCYYPQEISRLCDISFTAAVRRSCELVNWQNTPLPQEQALVLAMQDFIQEEPESVWNGELIFAPLPQLRSHRI